LKQKYVAVAVGGALLAAAALVAVLTYQNTVDATRLGEIAANEVRAQVVIELRARTEALARRAADAAAADLLAHDRGALARDLAGFGADATVETLIVRSELGTPLFEWRRAPVADAPSVIQTSVQPIRVPFAGGGSGGGGGRTVGELELALRSAAADPAAGVLARVRVTARQHLHSELLLVAALTGVGLLLAVSFAFWAGRRLEQPLGALIRSAERIGHGDYSRPLLVARRDLIGDLQQALERMRQRLRQTTINRHYLTSVLSSMTDAVFVTSADGVIRIANPSGCTLLGYTEEELVGRGIATVLDERERSRFDLLEAGRSTTETVVRTREGQTIPVSFTGAHMESDDPQFRGLIFVARNITDRKRAERRIRYLARYDTLTKVPNRMQFQHLLQQSIARAHKARQAIALLYLDMDRFKEVNDTFGHSAGDRTLEILTERLTRVLPKNTAVGRLAGDEFALFVDGLPADEDNRGPIGHLARSVLADVGKAFQLNGQEIYLTSSIGIAFCPGDAENVIDLIRNADAAMYYAKQNGGNTFAFYAPEMNTAAVERLMLKSKLRRALERDELNVRYEPKVDLRDGRIVGAEALLRWSLPGHGDIPPSQFIPLAEESNLILGIGEWVLNRVCRDYSRMRHEVADPGRISLNLSLKQLRQASFILHCRSVFGEHGVSPTSFELEITETTLMADAKHTVGLLNELHAMGLHLSIDDFGTGYSSLSALQQFPIETLKVDQSFVRDVGEDANDATIVRTIIEMGRSLGMNVVAEGVESLRHLEFLRAHQCQYGQGRLFGESYSPDQLLTLLKTQAQVGPAFGQLIAQSGARPATLKGIAS
jgi:diguanylate cyclase (GGDEF)-like protein/PAS domain S-box-containing protein